MQGMEKRALLAVIISLIILMIYMEYFAPRPPVVEKEKTEAPEKAAPIAKAPGQKAEVSAIPSALPQPTIQTQPGKDVFVDTPFYSAVFETRGARLKSWKVKKYLDKIGEEGKPIDLATGDLSIGYPFGLTITEGNFPFSRDALFQVNTNRLELTPQKDTGTLKFTWDSPEGLRVVQEMIFHAESYRIDLNLTLMNLSTRTFEGRPLLGWSGKNFTAASSAMGCLFFGGNGGTGASVPPFTALIKKELQEIEITDLKQERRFKENVQWGGFQSIYFLAAVVPKKVEGTELILKSTSDTTGELQMGGPKAYLPPRTQFAQSYAMYIGPKDLDALKAFGEDLDRALDFGWFDIVAKPMLYTLRFFYKYTGNYGVAIILLTILIKILFWYPTNLSYKSMKEMKKLQPEVAKLREKYGGDRERLQKETMDLYRRYKFNPMSGCLPMALQIPVFFALYKVLLYSIQIRHQPFVWWIQDLSAADPYYISPILMGASWFIQQWMTPTTGDPTQAKMMLIMPVIFTFMFLSFPAGLVLYWLVQNLLSIGQQVYINRQAT